MQLPDLETMVQQENMFRSEMKDSWRKERYSPSTEEIARRMARLRFEGV